MSLRHVISVHDLNLTELTNLFWRADDFARTPKQPYDILRGFILANVFYEASTRTFASFELAMKKLGGDTISIQDAAQFSSAKKGENLEDTVRTLCRYHPDGIVLRHPANGAAAVAASVSLVPIINAGDGSNEHPTQAFLDLYTIHKAVKDGRLPKDPLRIEFFGDNAHSRTVRSLAFLLALHGKELGVPIEGITFRGFENFAMPPEPVLSALGNAGIPVFAGGDIHEADSDVVYVTRSQKERHAGNAGNGVLVFTKEHAELLPPHAIVMHPLPRTEELPEGVDADERAWYFTQVENGLWVRMALLEMLLASNR